MIPVLLIDYLGHGSYTCNLEYPDSTYFVTLELLHISFSIICAQPDESMVYEGLVQYIVEKHIILTAELMVSS